MRCKTSLLIAAVLLACVILLSGCAGKFVCAFCGQEKSGRPETLTIQDTELKVCGDCMEKYQSSGGLMGMTLDALGGDFSSMQELMNGSSLDSLEGLMGGLGN